MTRAANTVVGHYAQSALKVYLAHDPQRKGLPGKPIDLQRTARMATFGLLLYGPAQHVWYGWLARQFPGASVRSFASKARAALKPSKVSTFPSKPMISPGAQAEEEGKCSYLDGQLSLPDSETWAGVPVLHWRACEWGSGESSEVAL